jgi:hypothetical protein
MRLVSQAPVDLRLHRSGIEQRHAASLFVAVCIIMRIPFGKLVELLSLSWAQFLDGTLHGD